MAGRDVSTGSNGDAKYWADEWYEVIVSSGSGNVAGDCVTGQ